MLVFFLWKGSQWGPILPKIGQIFTVYAVQYSAVHLIQLPGTYQICSNYEMF